jgi:hypothetical protein
MVRSLARPVLQVPERHIRAIIKVGDVAPSIVPLVHISNSPPEYPTVARESKRADEGDPSPVGRCEAQLAPDLARMEHDVVDTNVAVAATASDVDGVAQSRRSDAALITVAAASLALKITDCDVEAGVAGKTKKRPCVDFIFDVFAKSESENENEPTTAAAVGCRKRSRRNDAVTNYIVDDDEPARKSHRRPFKRQTRPPQSSTRQTRGAQRPTPQNDTKLIIHSVRRGESLASARWQVGKILDERQTDAGFMYEVTSRKGRKTRTLWQHWTDLDPEVLEGLLKEFKVKQRSMRRTLRQGRRDSDSQFG